MMRLMYLTLIVSVAIGVGTGGAQSNDEPRSQVQSFAGVVKTVSASTLAVERDGKTMTFAVDSSTRVAGRSTARARDLVFRTPGPGFADFVKTADQVTVRYRRSGGVLKAVEVRVIPQPK